MIGFPRVTALNTFPRYGLSPPPPTLRRSTAQTRNGLRKHQACKSLFHVASCLLGWLTGWMAGWLAGWLADYYSYYSYYGYNLRARIAMIASYSSYNSSLVRRFVGSSVGYLPGWPAVWPKLRAHSATGRTEPAADNNNNNNNHNHNHNDDNNGNYNSNNNSNHK